MLKGGKMMKNRLKETIEFVGLSYQRELLKIVVITLLCVGGAFGVYYLTHSLVFLIMIIIFSFVVDYVLFSRFNDKKRKLLKERENELIAIISYFDVYIQNNNNVYQSFNLLIPYCSDWLKDKIEQLLREIDADKSVQPFINFAKNFNQLSIHSLMLSIYQMVDQGENSEQLLHFNIIFNELSRNRNKEMMDQKEKALSSMSIFPLIGAGLITVTLTISILMILGDLINVL